MKPEPMQKESAAELELRQDIERQESALKQKQEELEQVKAS